MGFLHGERRGIMNQRGWGKGGGGGTGPAESLNKVDIIAI